MEKNFIFDNELFDEEPEEELEEEYEEEFEELNSRVQDINACLTETDFYPPSDNRVLESNVEDIDGGDNFADYCKEFFRMLKDEEYYDN